MRTARRLVVPVLVVVALVGLLTGCTRNAAALESAKYVNNTRIDRGLQPLILQGGLVDRAHAWSQQMAASGRAFHSNLNEIGGSWVVIGENVGMAGSVAEMHGLFMNSAQHRAAILNPRYTRYGTGVTQVGDRVYVVQIFAA